MEKIIKVNKYCEINKDNIAIVRDREIGINILQKRKNEKGFINYCLAIEICQRCCENWGAGFYKVIDFNEDNVFVSKIELNADISLDDVGNTLHIDELNSCYACKVYGKNNVLIAIGYVYNDHNGYYSHTIYEVENGEIIYEDNL